MRGEHGLTAKRSPPTSGSSPHARGTPVHGVVELGERGIIPACAGNTLSSYPATCPRWDHPRMRGEHLANGIVGVCVKGSSPHARGTHRRHRLCGQCAGIIPACAGNTDLAARPLKDRRDHPRMRGEHARQQACDTINRGSSPHARGTHMYLHEGGKVSGIIPACAGNTMSLKNVSLRRWDHPRMRGEHYKVLAEPHTSLGSSPHARGTLPSFLYFLYYFGIIPACAGNTCAV